MEVGKCPATMLDIVQLERWFKTVVFLRRRYEGLHMLVVNNIVLEFLIISDINNNQTVIEYTGGSEGHFLLYEATASNYLLTCL